MSISKVSSITVDTSSSSLHNHIEEVPVTEKPKFVFTPVNRFGHATNEEAKLKDNGMNVQQWVEGWDDKGDVCFSCMRLAFGLGDHIHVYVQL